LSSITTGTDPYTSDLRWQTSAYAPSLTQVQAYEAAALLSIDILGSGAGSVAQQDYSFALWGLFDPTDAFGQLTSYGDTTARNTAITDLNTAISDVTNPLARINGVSLSTYLSNWDVTIYSYDTGATGAGCGGPCPVPQEFITAVDPPTTGMAEPPAPALLGLDLLGIAGLILMARRRGWLAR
jgi:LPXTG-motif cell wall-anchored protein